VWLKRPPTIWSGVMASPPGQTLHYGAVCAGRPRNDGDREACRRVGRRLAEWVQTLVCHRPEHDPRKATYKRFTDD
jgi:NAD(P)H dehydrogenase (quinone)